MVIVKGLPDGWCIRVNYEWNGFEAVPHYQAYRWGRKEVRSGLFPRKKIVMGWHKFGPTERFSDVLVDFVHRTDREMRRERGSVE